jgi:pyruvate-ferredoxin/flavodoxin oxidoreductase
MMMAYGNCYVASVAMGADPNQLMKAITEAESFPGPSLIVAYAPCINHGIKAGMDQVQAEMKRAVDSGYWPLYRYDPRRIAEGKNPFQLDSKEPAWDKFQDFLEGEVRFLSLKKAAPQEAQELFDACKEAAQRRYKSYIRKTQEDWSL